MSRRSGQITVEAVLVLAILMSAVFAVSNTIKSGQYLSKLVERPWSHMAGMIENGIWMPAAAGKSKHPNHITRHGSPQGDEL